MMRRVALQAAILEPGRGTGPTTPQPEGVLGLIAFDGALLGG